LLPGNELLISALTLLLFQHEVVDRDERAERIQGIISKLQPFSTRCGQRVSAIPRAPSPIKVETEAPPFLYLLRRLGEFLLALVKANSALILIRVDRPGQLSPYSLGR